MQKQSTFSQAFLTTKDNKRCFLSREVKGPKCIIGKRQTTDQSEENLLKASIYSTRESFS